MTNRIKNILLAIVALMSVACADVNEQTGESSAAIVYPGTVKLACHKLALISIDCDAPESAESCGSRLESFETECRAAGVVPYLGNLSGMNLDQAIIAGSDCRTEASWPEQISAHAWVAVCGIDDGSAPYVGKAQYAIGTVTVGIWQKVKGQKTKS